MTIFARVRSGSASKIIRIRNTAFDEQSSKIYQFDTVEKKSNFYISIQRLRAKCDVYDQDGYASKVKSTVEPWGYKVNRDRVYRGGRERETVPPKVIFLGGVVPPKIFPETLCI